MHLICHNDDECIIFPKDEHHIAASQFLKLVQLQVIVGAPCTTAADIFSFGVCPLPLLALPQSFLKESNELWKP